MQVDLGSYSNKEYNPGPVLKRVVWYCISGIFFKSGLFPFYGLKRSLLRSFGAKIGKGVMVKPQVNIKYPWFLKIGDHSWIGENAWIDNLAPIKIGANVCISQGAYLLTGNHNYKKVNFDLMVKPIVIEDGAWIGAMSVVCPGVNCGSHAVLSAGSVATHDMESYSIYQGNPAAKVGERVIGD